jgi:hypothetical protein
MSEPENRRAMRITAAKLALKAAERYLARFPHATASPVVVDLKIALHDLMTELQYLTTTEATT